MEQAGNGLFHCSCGNHGIDAGRPGLHGIALKGGEKILSRFKAEKIAWAEKKIKENGT